MSDKPSASDEVVIKEYPNSTHLLEENQVRAAGNLVLTNKRLIFLRQTAFTEKEIQNLQRLSQEANTEKLIQFALTLHKKNFQIPLSSIVSAKLGSYFIFPSPQWYMRVAYKTASKKVKTVSFRFTLPLFKRLLMSEFPTLGWIRAIKKAVKAQRQTAGQQALPSRTA
jgi:hypothetical protein